MIDLGIRELPPTHMARLTARGLGAPQYGDVLGKLCRGLTRRRAEWLAVRHWTAAGTHAHFLLRAGPAVDAEDVAELWSRIVRRDGGTVPGTKGRPYLSPLEHPGRALSYCLGLTREGPAALPPRTFRGRVLSYSRGFLPRPRKTLFREAVAEWLSRRAA